MKRIAYLHTSLGYTAKVYRDVEWNEYRVKFYDTDGQHFVNADYHTDDKQEALDSARHILDMYKQED